ncbi:MAG: class I SAM-dependent DNA methyltransferase [Actinomycetes bacterium]
MHDYDPMTSFGADAAEIYDDRPRGDEDMAVAFLEELAGDGAALELAVGTGRIALPLAARGVRVDGIDLSPDMVARLRGKPGGDALAVTMGDFADVPVAGSYRLVYVVYNTLFNLLTQEDQVRCFENVAAHLTDDGSFVVEAFVPSFLYRLREDQYVDAEAIEVAGVSLDVGRHDPVTQRLDETHVVLAPGSVRLFPIVTRYSWPSELDLMGRIAGLRLKERWGGWGREPFTAGSSLHVSVYGR